MMSGGHPAIDSGRCVGCGLCVPVCPSKILRVAGGKAELSGRGCIGCGHCEAVCPEEAVRLARPDDWDEAFASFETGSGWMAPGEAAAGELVRLMRSTRSVRRYSEKIVPPELLEDLVRVGVTAPSGTNSQKWTFTILPGREAVLCLGAEVAGFFRRLNRLAGNALARNALKLVGAKALSDYHREHFASVREALRVFDEKGEDRLFHGAPAVIIVGSAPGASCPAEDALLATGRILLAAHAMGLGTCLIGYAVEAMRHDRRIARAVGIPGDETVHAVIALGWPLERYARTARRNRPLIRYFNPEPEKESG